ncbi:L-shaped tail fiber protein p132 [Escherichia phage vB_EcoS-26175IV]|uniref:L-shaped tail fiber protein p132 n=1 Tax=Escherichia phage vB_EcoS-26175I TaxID=2576478 RepID=A0A5P1M7B2_9CAUD|nr:L-shaped tail fiber protein p132 [Escherichia phage vB_EcoS-26175I]QDK00119.1 L-shaped tail fiber protein p132 [Escherichia phage vB_EcoS-26175II]QDK00360.1 L-shaped tail fiber protein p132 [Escherichia phage vB_EcoS-26175III]QDK00420.1 L-shaped tail fiber protein p132 [Escherichia phage vB_EcoS-26175IV]QDK00657.1 L-shaped tail fiber protein p132 [Escherichia phage vB_EcoS-26175V]WJZ69810.1 M-shaped tail fiber protein [Citrobacter phage YZU-L1]
MSTENRVIDIVVDEKVPYGLIMQFMDVNDSVYPPTEIPVNLTGYSLRGTIKSSLDENAEVLANFKTRVIDAAQGAAAISLSVADVTNIGEKASKERDKYNPRQRFAGYYDILMTRDVIGSEVSSFRIMEGKVYISDGVTQ